MDMEETQKMFEKMDEKTAIAVMARDIHYMKESMMRLEQTISEQMGHYQTIKEFENYKREHEKDTSEYKLGQAKINQDIENRMRTQEKAITKILTWGSVAVVLLNVAMFLIGKYL